MTEAKSRPEILLAEALAEAGYPAKLGHAFHAVRDWEFDLAWPQICLAVEINGRGRHQSKQGERRDAEKINAAVENGWRVLIYPARSVEIICRRALIVEQIARVICGVVCEESSAEVLETL